jgi:hypothetical protein
MEEGEYRIAEEQGKDGGFGIQGGSGKGLASQLLKILLFFPPALSQGFT